MRSIQCLMSSYPNKTGAEYLAMQEKDKIEDKLKFDEYHKEATALVKDYNDNGAYFRSRFGLNQYRYDKFYNLEINSNGDVYCNVETIVGFKNMGSPIEISFERKVQDYVNIDKFMPQEENRITEEDYNNLNTYLDETFTKFWT